MHADGPGARAGLQAGDLLVEIEGEQVSDFDDLRSRIGDFDPNDSVRLRLVRDGKPKTLQVKLGSRPAPSQLARMGGEFAPPAPPGSRGPSQERGAPPSLERKGRAGAPSTPRSAGQRPRLDLEVREVEGGLRVEAVGPGGLGARLGLRPGDVLTGVNGRRVRSSRDVQEAIEASSGSVSVSARRGDGSISSSILGAF